MDAGFIWTEPHSRRLKTKLSVQSEVFNGAILQQTFVVEYIVETHMCPDCSRAAANPNTWTAVVQVSLLTCYASHVALHPDVPELAAHAPQPDASMTVLQRQPFNLAFVDLQVRQHTEHKRTFMFLEQVILKYNAAGNCINIKDIHEVTHLPTLPCITQITIHVWAIKIAC